MEGQIATGATGFSSRRLNGNYTTARQQVPDNSFGLLYIIDPIFIGGLSGSMVKLRAIGGGEARRTTGPHARPYPVHGHICPAPPAGVHACEILP